MDSFQLSCSAFDSFEDLSSPKKSEKYYKLVGAVKRNEQFVAVQHTVELLASLPWKLRFQTLDQQMTLRQVVGFALMALLPDVQQWASSAEAEDAS